MKDMKKIMSLLFVVICSMTFAQSQAELNAQAEANYKETDKELNRDQAVLKDYASDKEFIRNLKASERLWVNFRDAEMKMKYPDNTRGG